MCGSETEKRLTTFPSRRGARLIKTLGQEKCSYQFSSLLVSPFRSPSWRRFASLVAWDWLFRRSTAIERGSYILGIRMEALAPGLGGHRIIESAATQIPRN